MGGAYASEEQKVQGIAEEENEANLNMNWKLHDILFSFLAVIMICGEEGEFPYFLGESF